MRVLMIATLGLGVAAQTLGCEAHHVVGEDDGIEPYAVAAAPDGSVYMVAKDDRFGDLSHPGILKVDTNGDRSWFIPPGDKPGDEDYHKQIAFYEDRADVEISWESRSYAELIVSPADGDLYLADYAYDRVLRIPTRDTDYRVEPVMGGPGAWRRPMDLAGEASVPASSVLGSVLELAADSHGNIFFSNNAVIGVIRPHDASLVVWKNHNRHAWQDIAIDDEDEDRMFVLFTDTPDQHSQIAEYKIWRFGAGNANGLTHDDYVLGHDYVPGGCEDSLANPACGYKAPGAAAFISIGGRALDVTEDYFLVGNLDGTHSVVVAFGRSGDNAMVEDPFLGGGVSRNGSRAASGSLANGPHLRYTSKLEVCAVSDEHFFVAEPHGGFGRGMLFEVRGSGVSGVTD